MDSSCRKKESSNLAKKCFTYVLILSFVVTMCAPLTGTGIHKMVSAIFLLLCIAHTIVNRKNLDLKKAALLVIVVVAFVSGIFALIYDCMPLISALHIVVSIAIVFFLAIHMYVFLRKIK